MDPIPTAEARKTLEVSAEADAATRVRRKIDRVLLPVLFLIYLLSFMDKIILASAAVFGLQSDTHLRGQQYSWISSIFYFGYLAWTYPTTLLVAKLPVGKYVTANMALWGTVVLATAACSSFAGLLVARFLLGMAEATVTPAAMFVISTWYTREEMPTRVGVCFAGNSIGGLLSTVLVFGIGNIPGGIRPWRWMYIILGSMTILGLLPVFMLLPDSISQAKMLDGVEKCVAAARVDAAGTGSTEDMHWKREQLVECLIDPKTWFLVLITLCCLIPNGSVQSFSNIVVESLGFTNLQSTLINIPFSILAASIIYVSGYAAGRYPNINCLLIVAVTTPCIAGAAIIYTRARFSHGTQLFAYFLLSAGPATLPLSMSLLQANFRGVTKKMSATAMMFVAYCVGNIAGPHIFRKSEAPVYASAFQAIVICYGAASVLCFALRIYLQSMNRRRVTVAGLGSDAIAGDGHEAGEMAIAPASSCRLPAEETVLNDSDDRTDWQTPNFKYRF